MKSIKELYRIGTGPFKQPYNGPSQSCRAISGKSIRKPPTFKVTLYGSLAATGKGHMTNICHHR